MNQQKLPMKRSIMHTEQFNLRVDRLLKDDILSLKEAGVEVAELLRPVVRAAVEDAKVRLSSMAEDEHPA